MTHPSRPRSPLWLVVLGLACEEPMHPYRMQTLIKQRGKDRVANAAQRNSVYQTIEALRRAGLVEIRGTSRDAHHPERTVYEATDEGRRALRAWIRTGLSTPAREFPEFPAVLSTPYGLRDEDDASDLLRTRARALESRLAELEAPVPDVPRIFLLEDEYLAAMTRAELAWINGIVDDLQSGELRFPSKEAMLAIGSELGGPTPEAVRRLAEQPPAPEEPPRPRRSRKGPKST